jgi:hypothetical protein
MYKIIDYFFGDFETYRKLVKGNWYMVVYIGKLNEYTHTYVEWRRSIPVKPHRVVKSIVYS